MDSKSLASKYPGVEFPGQKRRRVNTRKNIPGKKMNKKQKSMLGIHRGAIHFLEPHHITNTKLIGSKGVPAPEDRFTTENRFRLLPKNSRHSFVRQGDMMFDVGSSNLAVPGIMGREGDAVKPCRTNPDGQCFG